MTSLRTERLELRPARWSDLEAFHEIMSDPRAMAFWSTPPYTDIETTREWLGSMIEGGPRSRDFVIALDGRVVGKAGVWQIPEIGIILHPDSWGRGIAREALTAIIAYLWETTDTPRLTVDIDPRNDRSLALFEGLGFVETGRAERTFCIDGVWADSIYLALDRPAANRQRRATVRSSPRRRQPQGPAKPPASISGCTSPVRRQGRPSAPLSGDCTRERMHPMPRDALPLFISDLSDFTKKLRLGLAAETETPSHLALLGLIARSAGYSNFQELKASTPPTPKPDPSVTRALRVFDDQGRMTRWPTGQKVQWLCLWPFWTQIPPRSKMTEKEINEILKAGILFGDHVVLRRYLVDYQMVSLTRDGSVYERIEQSPPPEALAFLAALKAQRPSKDGGRFSRKATTPS